MNELTKICHKCNKEKSLSNYYKHPTSKNGYVSHCKACHKKYYTNYYEKNKDKIKQKSKIYNHNNKENIKKYIKENEDTIKTRSKEYYENNKEKFKEYRENNKEKMKEYYENNKEKMKEYSNTYYTNNKEYYINYYKGYTKNRYKSDPEFRIRVNVRSSFYARMNQYGNGKQNTFFEYTGIAIDEYIKHLKKDPLWKKFCDGCNIHIDHIIPVSLYDHTDPLEIKKCWHFKNLRLLCGVENLQKGNSFNYKLIEKYELTNILPKNLLKQ